MKKTIKRGLAVLMYNNLSALSFGNLPAELLEKVMLNMDALGEVAERHNKLMQELGKRLNEGIDEARANEYNAAVEKGESDEILRAKYPDLVELAQKQARFSESISAKDIEVEVELMDRKEFTKSIIKANPNVKYGLFALFTPLFTEEEKKDEDFSELDEIMADSPSTLEKAIEEIKEVSESDRRRAAIENAKRAVKDAENNLRDAVKNSEKEFWINKLEEARIALHEIEND